MRPISLNLLFGSFLYYDKKEHENGSSPCLPVAMQRFIVALWNAMACIAIHEEVACSYKCLAPTGLEMLFVVRVSLFVIASSYNLCNTVLHCVTL